MLHFRKRFLVKITRGIGTNRITKQYRFKSKQDALDCKHDALYDFSSYYKNMPNVDIYWLESEETKDIIGVYVVGSDLDESIYVDIIET